MHVLETLINRISISHTAAYSFYFPSPFHTIYYIQPSSEITRKRSSQNFIQLFSKVTTPTSQKIWLCYTHHHNLAQRTVCFMFQWDNIIVTNSEFVNTPSTKTCWQLCSQYTLHLNVHSLELLEAPPLALCHNLHIAHQRTKSTDIMIPHNTK